MNSRPAAQEARTRAGRRATRGPAPTERHFPGFVPPPDDDEEQQPFAGPEAYEEPLAPVEPQPVLSVDEIVGRAVESALTAAREGRLTLADLQAERQRVNSLRPGVDGLLRELRETKPPFWRERRFWMMKVREMTHNRMHILNRQIVAVARETQAPATPAAEPAPPGDSPGPVSA